MAENPLSNQSDERFTSTQIPRAKHIPVPFILTLALLVAGLLFWYRIKRTNTQTANNRLPNATQSAAPSPALPIQSNVLVYIGSVTGTVTSVSNKSITVLVNGKNTSYPIDTATRLLNIAGRAVTSGKIAFEQFTPTAIPIGQKVQLTLAKDSTGAIHTTFIVTAK